MVDPVEGVHPLDLVRKNLHPTLLCRLNLDLLLPLIAKTDLPDFQNHLMVALMAGMHSQGLVGPKMAVGSLPGYLQPINLTYLRNFAIPKRSENLISHFLGVANAHLQVVGERVQSPLKSGVLPEQNVGSQYSAWHKMLVG